MSKNVVYVTILISHIYLKVLTYYELLERGFFFFGIKSEIQSHSFIP